MTERMCRIRTKEGRGVGNFSYDYVFGPSGIIVFCRTSSRPRCFMDSSALAGLFGRFWIPLSLTTLDVCASTISV